MSYATKSDEKVPTGGFQGQRIFLARLVDLCTFALGENVPLVDIWKEVQISALSLVDVL